MSAEVRPGAVGLLTLERDERGGTACLRLRAAARARLLLAREFLALAAVLAAGVGIRLVLISQPFVDRWSAREADVAMIARNFYRHGFNIFYPQIDWAGSAPGYVGTEFPLVPFAASLLYPVFGEHEWIGRSISVFFFAMSVPFLYLLVRKVSNRRAALWAASVYSLAPLGIFSSRSFMPDIASVGLSIAAVYLFAEWMDREASAGLYWASAAAAGLAILIKAPTAIMGLPCAYLAASVHGARFARRPQLWAWAAVALGPSLAWYLHAYAVSRAYVPHHMFGEGGLQLADLGSYAEIVERAATSELTPPVALAMLAGLLLPFRQRFGGLFHWWLVAIIVFTFLMGRGSSVHAWYQLPLVPVAAAFVGRACDEGLGRVARAGRPWLAIALACLYLAGLTASAAVSVRPLYESWATPLRDAGRELDRVAPAAALAVFTEWDPTTVYYSGRKGWRLERNGIPWEVPRDTQEALDSLDLLRGRGAQYLVFTRYARWWFDRYPGFENALDSRYSRLRDTDEYRIYDLRAPALGRGTRLPLRGALVSRWQGEMSRWPDSVGGLHTLLQAGTPNARGVGIRLGEGCRAHRSSSGWRVAETALA